MKKKFKKIISLMLVFSMVLSGSLFLPQNTAKVQAASRPSLNSFGISSLSTNSSIVGISLNLGTSAQVALCSAKGKILDKDIGYSYVSFNNIKKNRLYYYKVRSMKYNSSTGDYTPTSSWSKSKAFSTAVITRSLANKYSSIKTVVFKFPKVTGIKKYNFYVSTSQNSGYKKVATVQAGKSYSLTKVNGSYMTYYKTYYYKYVPVTTSGQSCRGMVSNFYIYRSY